MSIDHDPKHNLLFALKKEVGRHLSKEVLGDSLKRMESVFAELKSLCRDEEGCDLAILMKCFRTVHHGGARFFMPRSRTMLPVKEILRLLQLGFRLGKVDERFEIRMSGQERTPYFNGRPLPKDQWEQPYPCVLKHEALSVLRKEMKQACAQIDEVLAGNELKSQKQLHKSIRPTLEQLMLGFLNPSKSRLARPPPIPLHVSMLRTHDGQAFETALSERAKAVLQKQSEGIAPSLFNPETWQNYRDLPITLVILLDISASTQERELFKAAQIGCASLLSTLCGKMKAAQLHVVAYSDNPQTPLTELRDFLPPSGTTNYESAFACALELIREGGAPGVVLNITDGLPDSLEKARNAGAWFPTKNIEYAQVVFGHADRVDDLLHYLMAREGISGTPPEETRFGAYVSHFTSVARACRGSQLVLWMINALPEAMLSLTDISVATQMLLQHPDHQGWLKNLEDQVKTVEYESWDQK